MLRIKSTIYLTGQANLKEIPNYKHPAKKTADRQIPNKG
jgi:hypothetical protein